MSLTEDVGVWEGFQLDARHGRHDRLASRRPRPSPAQIVKVLLIVLGVGTLFYGLVTVTEVFVAGPPRRPARRAPHPQRPSKPPTTTTSSAASGAWAGRSRATCARPGARYVVVDAQPENRELAAGVGVRFIEGAADRGRGPARRGDHARARRSIACVDSDAENIFITLTARELRPDIAIVARAAAEDVRAQAAPRRAPTRVISPYKTSGAEMARLALNPQVSGVVDVAPEYRMEEIEVARGLRGRGPHDRRRPRRCDHRRRARAPTARSSPSPPPRPCCSAGDVVMAMGTLRTMERLEALFEPGRGRRRGS